MCLEQNNAFYNDQFKFRNNKSTNRALIEIIKQIWNGCDKIISICGVCFDLQKVFDTVNHEIILTKLKNHGIRVASYKWFQLFLVIDYNIFSSKRFSSIYLSSRNYD